MQREMQDQVLFLCRTLGFEYVRIWDLYDERMHINVGDKNGKYNFSRLDTCLDFLVKHNIKPYLELGFKPYILLKEYEHFLFDEERAIPFEKPKEYGDFIRKMMIHFVNRYGIQTVTTWIYEVWGDPRWFPEGDASTYIVYFEYAYQAVKDIAPIAKVGGEYDRSYGIISFENFIRQWSLRSIQPDFVSIYCYAPVIRDVANEEAGKLPGTVTAEMIRNFRIEDYIELRKRTLMRYGMMMPLYISEWNFTVINANVLNDSRFKGAYMMRTIMDINHEIELLGYWFGTDLFVDKYEAPKLLNGHCGLITHQGICKPAYWVLWMMNRLEPYLLEKNSNIMVTRNDFDSYVIACHNYKELDIQYYVQKERDVTIESIPNLYIDNKIRIMKIRISGVRNGKYHIKTRVVNSQYGCVQDEWVRMGRSAYLTDADTEYIDHVSRPHIAISECEVTNSVLSFVTRLEAQEIQLIHAYRYIEE